MGNNFKVKCVKAYSDYTTVGKIYEVVNGVFTYDNGRTAEELCLPVEEMNKRFVSKFELAIDKKSTPLGESITIRRKKSKVIATLSIDGEFKYSQYIKLVDANNDFKTAVKMVVERLMDKWDGGKVDLTAVESNRQAMIGEYIKITNGERHKAKVGELYKVESVDGNRFVSVKIESGSMQLICNDQYVIVENPIKKVKRPAKVGEWIEVVDGCASGQSNHYKNGDILQVVKYVGYCGAYWKDEDGCYLYDKEYLVLENYTPEVTPEEVVAPSKFVKAKVGDWVEIVDDSDPTYPEVKNGKRFKIEDTDGICVTTEEGYFLSDSRERYVIVDAPIKISDKLVSDCTQEELMKELFNRQGL